MTTALQAFDAIKARVEAQFTAAPVRWQGEGNTPLPDEPAPFVFVEFDADPQFLAGFGGGRGQNRYRNPALINAYCFVPSGHGTRVALTLAEQFATVFRSHRDSDISCFDASVYPGGSGANLKPPGLSTPVGNYDYATVEVSLYYDLIG